MWHGDGPITMAQACGEQPYGPLSFCAGVDFDPSDLEEVEIVRLASEKDAQSTIDRLRDENAEMRRLLGNGPDDEYDGDPDEYDRDNDEQGNY